MATDSMRIRHTVSFRLKHAEESQGAKDFMTAAKKLSAIEGVEKFEYLKEISPKNAFAYGISMEFANRKVYDSYSHHPDHIAFIQTYWQRDVEDFLEVDYQLED